MAQRKPDDKTRLNQVLKLVDQLSLADLDELRRKLNLRDWGEQWRQLVKDVAEDNKSLPPLSDEEIVQEVMDYRREQRTKRAQGHS